VFRSDAGDAHRLSWSGGLL